MGALVLTHLAALALCWYAPRFWVAQDVKAFNANPADDTSHGKFHRQRLTWRVALGVLVALTASEPALPHWGAFACSSGALLSFGAAYFFYDFNPRLNKARGLAYVGQYYVSFDPNAAWFPDRWLARRARAALPTYGQPSAVLDANRRAYAARQLQQLGRWVLETGALCYALLTLLAFVLL
ncbi:hypothetical protein [Hymenobacter nivis]|uniref:Uncharacterized protein n=1 Tax=Hymenobacter nivis TaxID=1850093 RepID=A0A2Z3GHR6_9BACT|nr:hypothetical protein [Hymenobacter nivis]AWM31342.1 hypothetical protein DDQ68_00200 [Hymenobacter nivis]